MPVVVNTSTGLAENLPQDQIDAALANGTHEVPLKDPEGNFVTAPIRDATSLLSQGYSQPSVEENTAALSRAKYSSTAETAKAYAEAGARGVLSGTVATGIERALGVKPEDIRGRQEAHETAAPLIEGAAFLGSAFTGFGEAKVLSKLGAGVKGLTGVSKESGLLAKAAASGLGMGSEFAAYSAFDEGSKFLMNDPGQTSGSALANIGYSAALGGAGGAMFGAISPLWKMTAGPKVAQMLEDFSSRLKYRAQTPDVVGSIAGQLSDFHTSLTDLNKSIWGNAGLKAKAAAELLPEMNEKILSQSESLQEKLSDAVRAMKEDPHRFSSSNVANIESELEKLKLASTVETDPVTLEVKKAPNSQELFEQINKTKQHLQELSDYEHFSAPADRPFIGTVKSLAQDFKGALESTEAWGEAADVQKQLNKAGSRYFSIAKNFETRFGSLVGKDRVIDPGKIATFVNQLPKDSSTIKKSILGEYIEAGKNYREAVGGVFGKLGLESPHVSTPLDHVENTLGKVSLGQKAADYIYTKGVSNLIGEGIGFGAGAGIGSLLGHPFIGGIIGERALAPFFSSVLPAITKPIMEKIANIEAFNTAAKMGIAALKAKNLVSSGVKAVFNVGSHKLSEENGLSKEERKKLLDSLTRIEADPSHLLNVGGQAGYYLPDHATEFAKTVSQGAQFLNSIKPKETANSPLDKKPEISVSEERRYNRALDLSENPLLVLKSVKEGSLSSQDIHVVNATNPGWLGLARQEMFSHIAKMGDSAKTLTMPQKVSLSIFLNKPLDSNLTPGVMISNQTALAGPSLSQQSAPASGRRQALGPMKNIKLSQRSATRTQREEEA